ncbi:hypothetical protein HAX54_000726 [Datura stramonium]|uniref:Uncharacterized protein n=1 Tax=Datura stramonium TaxID=4076 RepID=A0ABS8T3M1_DATST|nr:hypothetical protein [Datura stramonium]
MDPIGFLDNNNKKIELACRCIAYRNNNSKSGKSLGLEGEEEAKFLGNNIIRIGRSSKEISKAIGGSSSIIVFITQTIGGEVLQPTITSILSSRWTFMNDFSS